MLIGIFGTGRNGSTLLGRLMDGLESTYVHPVEENLLSALADLARFRTVRRATVQNCTIESIEAYLDSKIASDRLQTNYQGRLDDLNRLVRQNIPGRESENVDRLDCLLPAATYLPTDFVSEYLQVCARIACPADRFEHFMVKTAETPYVPEYARRFPDMRFIHIIRDPVATCSSQKRTLLNKKYPAAYLGHDWLICMLEKRWIPHAKSILSCRDDARHLVVRYEDLVADPGKEIRRISAGLRLEPPMRYGIQTIFNNRDFLKLDHNPSKAGVETPREVVSNLQSALHYDEVLSKREIDLINLKTGKLQEQLGYVPSSGPSRAHVLAEYAVFDRWEWANVRGVRGIAKAMYGAIYRRISIF